MAFFVWLNYLIVFFFMVAVLTCNFISLLFSGYCCPSFFSSETIECSTLINKCTFDDSYRLDMEHGLPQRNE